MFLDIEMPDTNGLDVAVKIREENQEVPIIFISWHQKYEHQSFLVHPFSFILKSFVFLALDFHFFIYNKGNLGSIKNK